MRMFVKLSFAVVVGAGALGAAGFAPAKAADMPMPQAQMQPPDYYGAPPVQEGYAYPPPPAVYGYPPPRVGYGYPPRRFVGPYWYGRGPYWRGYGPRYGYRYARRY